MISVSLPQSAPLSFHWMILDGYGVCFRMLHDHLCQFYLFYAIPIYIFAISTPPKS